MCGNGPRLLKGRFDLGSNGHICSFLSKNQICKKITGQCCATLSLFQVGLSGSPPTKKKLPQNLQPLQLMMLTYPRLSKANEGQCA